MCLITFAWKYSAKYNLVLLANRDEFYGRPAKPLHWWNDGNIAAGLDLQGGGTWLGISRNGRWAAITNFRGAEHIRENSPTRGKIVSEYLGSALDPEEYLNTIQNSSKHYNGYNLLVGTAEKLFYYSNVQQEIIQISPGIYGLSNHLLDTPWPKVVRAKAAFREYINSEDELSAERAFDIMSDTVQAEDIDLPDTNIGLELERLLSSISIQSPLYGTKNTSLLKIHPDRSVEFSEKDILTGNIEHIRFVLA